MVDFDVQKQAEEDLAEFLSDKFDSSVISEEMKRLALMMWMVGCSYGIKKGLE